MVEWFQVKDYGSKVTGLPAGLAVHGGNIPGAAEGKKHKRNEAPCRSSLPLRNDKPQHTAARDAAVAPPLGQQRKYFPLVYLPTSKTPEEFLIVRLSSRDHGRRVKNKKQESSLT